MWSVAQACPAAEWWCWGEPLTHSSFAGRRRWCTLYRLAGCGRGGLRWCSLHRCGCWRRRRRRLGHCHAGRRGLHHRCATLFAKIAAQVQRSLAETANDRARMDDVSFERFLQGFFVNFHFLIVKAGTRVQVSASGPWRHNGRRSDFERNRRCLRMGHLRRWIHLRDGLLRGRGWRKRRPALKAETHPVGTT